MVRLNVINYIESLQNPDGLFRTLKNIEIVKDMNGQPYYITGSNSVIFKAHMSFRPYALKFFTDINEEITERYKRICAYVNLYEVPYLKKYFFLENELYVFGTNERGTYYPVLIYEFTEGISLARSLIEKTEKKDIGSLKNIIGKFTELILWLLDHDLAHGDIKTENIIIDNTEDTFLIDIDGMYVPELAGKNSMELGSVNFQHSNRNFRFFNRHIDDFSLALIYIGLKALIWDPELYKRPDSEKFIFTPTELIEGNSPVLKKFKEECLIKGDTATYGLIRRLQNCSPEINGIKEYFELPKPELQLEDKPSGFSLFVRNGFYGYIDNKSGEIIDPVYDQANSFSEGAATVRIMKEWMLIDGKGQVIKKIGKYDVVGPFSEDLAVVKKKNKFGFIDKSGEIVINLDYDNAGNFHEGLAGVKINGKYGFINSLGEIKIEPEFDMAGNFHEGIAVYETDGKFGYVNSLGKKIFDPVFDFGGPVKNGVATAEYRNSTVKIIIRNK
ncbi:MAG: WG repeat-containing protein [Rikenellaceae bacterium]|nr:WG repeat-containing protein [Rikenellaceae bacterium]